MLAFLTIIAPLMAMTYPLDKLQDGSAQGFNTWLKEYIFNLLIQPVHLILYTVLIGASMDLVADNIVFALVALGFILQAEKYYVNSLDLKSINSCRRICTWRSFGNARNKPNE